MQQLNYLRFYWQYKRIYDRIRNNQINSILDLGCGNGELVISFSMLFPETNITGVDKYSDYKQSIERKLNAEKLISNSGLSKQCKIVEADAFDLPFEDKEFNLIHARNSLHHMFDSQNADTPKKITSFLIDIKNLLKKNNHLVISEIGPVNYLSYAKFLIPKKFFFINQAHNMDYKSKVSCRTWITCLKQAGFNIDLVEYYVPYRLRFFRKILACNFFSRFSHSSFMILAQRTD